jgi:hypothetical protein
VITTLRRSGTTAAGAGEAAVCGAGEAAACARRQPLDLRVVDLRGGLRRRRGGGLCDQPLDLRVVDLRGEHRGELRVLRVDRGALVGGRGRGASGEHVLPDRGVLLVVVALELAERAEQGVSVGRHGRAPRLHLRR